MAEHYWFRRVMKIACPKFKEYTWNTVKSDIFKIMNRSMIHRCGTLLEIWMCMRVRYSPFLKLITPSKEEKDEILRMRDEELAKKLYKVQQEKKCFVVDKDMENLGREMVGSCAGLPLAIIVLGGLLATKETPYEWDMVHKNIKSHLARSKERGKQARLSEVFALNYHELPYQLKPFFLHLSQFPEDFEIPTKKLDRQWVAEGFVSLQDEVDVDERHETMEEVAKSYLHDLINRSMVQVGVKGSTGTIKSCRLHDLMRDLCLSKARQENFIHIIGALPSSANSRPTSAIRIRRCVIHLDQNNHDPALPEYQKNPNLRSLFFFRIKGLEEKLPEDVGILVQLRFLSLKKTRIRELPTSLVNLVGLQTIDKVSWESTVQVPNILWKMEQLRHLYLPKWCGNVTDDLQLANLSNLQTLVNFPANKCDVRKLIPLCPGGKEGRIENLPQDNEFPSSLTKLTLWGSRLAEDPMEALGKLPHLKYLSGWEVFILKEDEENFYKVQHVPSIVFLN
ncbi:hypothetical protein HRI_000291800 [Hibiscus trionum]|uniref:NB-ARC domain-containing protein n=1 Tax=Hibiscus trionum TaxID=183268 RepID=A0A9W7GV75_HIBTR|nr:hypothetical protein HRI_000291800 [Hibiscus trionum]